VKYRFLQEPHGITSQMMAFYAIYFDHSFDTVTSEPSLYQFLMFHVPISYHHNPLLWMFIHEILNKSEADYELL
jgi:hypothetical protein